MESFILTKENKQEILNKLTEFVKDKKYWIGITYGRIESAEDPSHDWFRGVGNFERIVRLRIYENHHDHGLQIDHINAVDSSCVVPRDDIILYGAEIILAGNDLLYYEDNKHISPQGGTNLYMEWTMKRNEFYKK